MFTENDTVCLKREAGNNKVEGHFGGAATDIGD